jgi:hypothetical protein
VYLSTVDHVVFLYALEERYISQSGTNLSSAEGGCVFRPYVAHIQRAKFLCRRLRASNVWSGELDENIPTDETADVMLEKYSVESSCKLHVSGFPSHISEQDLRALFIPFGELLGVSMTVSNALVVYGTRSETESAVRKLNGYCFPGCRGNPLIVKVSADIGSKTQRNDSKPRPTDNRSTDNHVLGSDKHLNLSKDFPVKLYVKGHPRGMRRNELQEYFSRHGSVIDTIICDGFAFVVFKTKAEAEVAIRNLHGSSMPGVPGRLTVRIADTGYKRNERNYGRSDTANGNEERNNTSLRGSDRARGRSRDRNERNVRDGQSDNVSVRSHEHYQPNGCQRDRGDYRREHANPIPNNSERGVRSMQHQSSHSNQRFCSMSTESDAVGNHSIGGKRHRNFDSRDEENCRQSGRRFNDNRDISKCVPEHKRKECSDGRSRCGSIEDGEVQDDSDVRSRHAEPVPKRVNTMKPFEHPPKGKFQHFRHEDDKAMPRTAEGPRQENPGKEETSNHKQSRQQHVKAGPSTGKIGERAREEHSKDIPRQKQTRSPIQSGEKQAAQTLQRPREEPRQENHHREKTTNHSHYRKEQKVIGKEIPEADHVQSRKEQDQAVQRPPGAPGKANPLVEQTRNHSKSRIEPRKEQDSTGQRSCEQPRKDQTPNHSHPRKEQDQIVQRPSGAPGKASPQEEQTRNHSKSRIEPRKEQDSTVQRPHQEFRKENPQEDHVQSRKKQDQAVQRPPEGPGRVSPQEEQTRNHSKSRMEQDSTVSRPREEPDEVNQTVDQGRKRSMDQAQDIHASNEDGRDQHQKRRRGPWHGVLSAAKGAPLRNTVKDSSRENANGRKVVRL